MTFIEVIALFIGGSVAGALNTLASSGSAVTLPLLIFLGIPPGIANGTNRISVLAGSLFGVISFAQAKAIPWRKTYLLSLPLVAGTAIGAGVATQLGDDNIQFIVNLAIITALIMLIVGSKKFISKIKTEQNNENPIIYIALFFVGLWTGLIVLDSATYMLLALVMLSSMDVTQANPIKSVFLLTASIISVPIFLSQGQIAWIPGIVLALGSSIGSWWAARLAIKKWIKKWIYYLLVFVIGCELIILFQ